MGICTDACDCYLEGERGLEGNGIGTDGNPFTWGAAPDRTVPKTVSTAASLGTPNVIDIGRLAHTIDTGLVHAYQPLTEGGLTGSHWTVAGDWNEFLPPDQTVPILGEFVSYRMGTVRAGMWDVVVTGYCVVDCEPNSLTVVVIYLYDVTSGTVFRQTRTTHAEDSGFQNARTMPFTVQHVVSSGPGSDNPSGTTKTLALGFQRVSANDSAGSVLSLKCRIRRLASHSSF